MLIRPGQSSSKMAERRGGHSIGALFSPFRAFRGTCRCEGCFRDGASRCVPIRRSELVANDVRNDPTQKLQVANMRPEDAGRGIARLSHEVMQQIGIREGEPVAISGKRRTAAIAMSPYPEDEGLALVRLD